MGRVEDLIRGCSGLLSLVKGPDHFVIHHGDMDGIGSGAVALRALTGNCRAIAANYGGDRGIEDSIPNGASVYILDYGLEPIERMLALVRRARVIVIDHHKSHMLALAQYPQLASLPGLRVEGLAGVELTWKYFHGEVPYPLAVRLIGRFDVWNHGWSEDVIPFHFGLSKEYHDPASPLWDSLLAGEGLEEVLGRGRIVWQYYQERAVSMMRHAYETEWEGHRCLVCNLPGHNSLAFRSIYDPSRHDMVVTWVCSSHGYEVGIYNDSDNGLDVSEIASRYHGGGHPEAAGFLVRALPPALLPSPPC